MHLANFYSETTSIPVNPRTNRPVGYAFVDLKSADEATKAIQNLSGKDILERKVSVQLARKPEDNEKKVETGDKERGTGRGRGGRGRGRAGRARGGRAGGATDGAPLADVTNEANKTEAAPEATAKDSAPRAPKQRGPPEDGIPSTTKVMVANLPYDLTEEKVSNGRALVTALTNYSSRNSSLPTNPSPPRLPSALSPALWSRSCRLAVRLARVVASVSLPWPPLPSRTRQLPR